MVKLSTDDLEFRRAYKATIEGTNQKFVLSIRVAKRRGICGKTGKIDKGHMDKPRVLAISSKLSPHISICFPLSLFCVLIAGC